MPAGPVPKPPQTDLLKILAIGLAFHIAAIASIFDIYFQSPLAHGQRPTAILTDAPAKRLVFIVGDGLRADKCFAVDAAGAPVAPFLHEMAAKRGSFGVSHTRVPTESRPGHVAMLAGFYEDPSAVMKGWKENPVDFDHLLEQCTHAFSFGAPEILSMFRGKHVHGHAYAESLVDFGLGQGILEQDKWPFDRMNELLDRARTDIELNDKLRSDRVFFFLHLLGHDTHGHAYGPQSAEYAANTRFIDAKIRALSARLDDFYNDGRTAYVFTADHGMSDRRAHGDGHPDCTRTPLVVWGPGVAPPEPDELLATHRDLYSRPWGPLSALKRRDINQADLTPLVASLLGIPIPVNSQGILPSAYLADHNKAFKSRACLRNALQIFENYVVKEAERRRKTRLGFRGFEALSVQSGLEWIERLQAQLRRGEHGETVRGAEELMAATLAGIEFLDQYDQSLLWALMTCGYIGWMVFGLLGVLSLYTGYSARAGDRSGASPGVPGACLALLFGLLYSRSAPLHYYAYAVFPPLFLHYIVQSMPVAKAVVADAWRLGGHAKDVLKLVCVLEMIVVAYFDRRAMSAIYGLVAGPLDRAKVLSLAMSAFTLLPPIKDPNTAMYIAGCAMALGLLVHGRRWVHVLVALATMANVVATDIALANKNGLALPSQALSWALLLSSLGLLLLERKHRLVDIFGALLPALMLLSVSYEVAFFSVFHVYLDEWLGREREAGKGKGVRWVALRDLSSVGEFLVAINMAFFGTGNIASLASFSVPSVYRLVTVFRPFVMSSLLICKQVVPLVLLAAAFGRIISASRLHPFSLFLLSMVLIDIVSLHFFFMVSNVGSWLEIGMGISRFVISNVFIVLGLGMYGLAQFMK